LKITKLADKELEAAAAAAAADGQVRTTPVKKNKKASKTPNHLESGIKLDMNQESNPSKLGLLGEKDDRSTEVSSNVSNNPSVKSEDQILLSKSKSCYPDDLGNKQGNLKKSTKKDILNGMQLPSEIEEFLNNSNLLHQIQFPTVRKIGTLTVEERRAKIEKYLQKRKKRTWNKKISYDCRKKVADSRLRIKGRFVTKEQAVAMLGGDGIYDLDKISSSEIKDLLNLKFGPSISKKKEPSSGKDTKSKDNENSSNEGDISSNEVKKEDNTESEEPKRDDKIIPQISCQALMKQEEDAIFTVLDVVEPKIESVQ